MGMELSAILVSDASRSTVAFIFELNMFGVGLALLESVERMAKSLMAKADSGCPRMTMEPSGILSLLPHALRETDRLFWMVTSRSGSLKLSLIAVRRSDMRVPPAPAT